MLATCSENDEQARRNPLAREIGCDGVGLSSGERQRRQGGIGLMNFALARGTGTLGSVTGQLTGGVSDGDPQRTAAV